MVEAVAKPLNKSVDQNLKPRLRDQASLSNTGLDQVAKRRNILPDERCVMNNI